MAPFKETECLPVPKRFIFQQRGGVCVCVFICVLGFLLLLSFLFCFVLFCLYCVLLSIYYSSQSSFSLLRTLFPPELCLPLLHCESIEGTYGHQQQEPHLQRSLQSPCEAGVLTLNSNLEMRKLRYEKLGKIPELTKEAESPRLSLKFGHTGQTTLSMAHRVELPPSLLKQLIKASNCCLFIVISFYDPTYK